MIHANASLRELRHNKSLHKYRAYVEKLAEADDVDAKDEHAVNRYDSKRKGTKLSNEDWENPQYLDARIGRDTKGATRMLYKAEHIERSFANAIESGGMRRSALRGQETSTKCIKSHMSLLLRTLFRFRILKQCTAHVSLANHILHFSVLNRSFNNDFDSSAQETPFWQRVVI